MKPSNDSGREHTGYSRPEVRVARLKTADGTGTLTLLVEARPRVEGLEHALAVAHRDYEELASMYESLELSHRELQGELEARRALLADLQERVDALKVHRSGGLDTTLRDAMLAALDRRPTPEQSLRVVQALYPDRLVVQR